MSRSRGSFDVASPAQSVSTFRVDCEACLAFFTRKVSPGEAQPSTRLASTVIGLSTAMGDPPPTRDEHAETSEPATEDPHVELDPTESTDTDDGERERCADVPRARCAEENGDPLFANKPFALS